MKRFSAIYLSFSCTLLLGCMNSGMQPAVLNSGETDNGSSAIIETAISEMLHGTPVSIARTAFRENSELILERNAANQLGRSYEMPFHFRLWVDGGNCRIEHVESGEIRTLDGLSCTAMTQR